MDALQIVCRILLDEEITCVFGHVKGISISLTLLKKPPNSTVDNLVQGLLVELIEHNNVIDTV